MSNAWHCLFLPLIFIFLKKAYKISLKVLLGVLVLILVLWMLLQTSFFQNFIIHRVAKTLSKNLKTKVSIRHVDLELFDKMSLQGLLVLDHKKDTLLYAGAARVSITDWFFFKENIVLKYIGLDDAIINLNRTDSVWNYQFLADYFSSPAAKTDTSKDVVHLDLKVINLKRIKIWQQDEWRGENMLVSLNQLNLRADRFDLENKKIQIGTITIDKPVFSQYDYTGKRPPKTTINSITNADELSGLQWNPDGWHITANNITLKDGAVAIEREGKTSAAYNEFDERHIVLSEINGVCKNIDFTGDTLKANITLSTKDRGGFVIKKLSTDYKFTPKMMEFNNLDLITAKSHLKDYFAMHYNSFNDDMLEFVNAVRLEGRFVNSVLDSDDLAYFAPETRIVENSFFSERKCQRKSR